MRKLAIFGDITHVSVDGQRKTAIIRFKEISSAKAAYLNSREIDEYTGNRHNILREVHKDAQMVYVIPEVSKEDEEKLEAEKNNKVYNPLKDDNLSLDQITKLINDKNEEVKMTFKKFCEAPPDSQLKTEMQQKLKETKQTLNEYLQKEKQIKMAFAIKKQKQHVAANSPTKTVPAPLVLKPIKKESSVPAKMHPPEPVEMILSEIQETVGKISNLITML
jgi:hypothetical protein